MYYDEDGVRVEDILGVREEGGHKIKIARECGMLKPHI
jgi:hypothetical protein